MDCVLTDFKDIKFNYSKWLELGLKLGLYAPTLDTIKTDHQLDGSERCLMACLNKWLRKVDNAKETTMVALGHALKQIGEQEI